MSALPPIATEFPRRSDSTRSAIGDIAAIRGMGVTEHPPEDRYSGLMFAARITLAHFSVSSDRQ
jgi:hypothetical protein